MEETRPLKGRSITHGKVTAEAVVSKSAFGFYGAVDPQTGVVCDKRHELYGRQIAGKVLVFPEGRGSTGGALYMLELARCGTAPAAIVNTVTEPILAAGAILAEKFYKTVIPVIDNLDPDAISELTDGIRVTVDADRGEVSVER
jgi:hypothetical protein